MRTASSAFLAYCLIFVPVAAAAFDSGSDGSDGAFNPLVSTQIDLDLAGTGPGTGTYDPDLWAVIFNYTDVTIPAGVSITFANHASGAPVVWLASGDVVIEGDIVLNGSPGNGSGLAGPGGFAGADFDPRTRAFGPGGAGYTTAGRGSGGSYGSAGQATQSTVYPPYGNEQILPLIGGSGGAASGTYNARGGGGGGAILIAASGTLTCDGDLSARGGDAVGLSSFYGSGAGSGGGVRLLATTLNGDGTIVATGGGIGGPGGASGGTGRIRCEAENLNITATSNPTWTYDLTPGPVFQDATTPVVKVTTINGQAVTADPLAGFDTIDHTMGATGPVAVGIEANNVPVGTTVDVHIVKKDEVQSTVVSTPLVGSLALSTATATVDFASLVSTEIYLKVNW